jgi:hypothetical protein
MNINNLLQIAATFYKTNIQLLSFTQILVQLHFHFPVHLRQTYVRLK